MQVSCSCVVNIQLKYMILNAIYKASYFLISQDSEGCLPWCLAVLKAMKK